MKRFIHLHVHSYYSVGDAMGSVREYIDKAVADGMKGMAVTDHRTLAGIPDLFCHTKFINKNRGKKDFFKPIAGCELNVTNNKFQDYTPIGRETKIYNLTVLAKNLTGYRNIVKLVNESNKHYMMGQPVVTKALLEQNHEGLIFLSGCLGGEIPCAIMNDDIERAKSAILYYKNIFGDDFYLELMRHKTSNNDATLVTQDIFPVQQKVNDVLIRFSKECGVKLVATNDCHFPTEEDAEDHDTLLYKTLGKSKQDPNRLKYTRQEWLKSQEDMNELFSDVPEAIDNTMEIWNKCELYEINRKPEPPNVSVPTGYKNADDYLTFLTHDGATRKYGTPIPGTVAERIDFELDTIKKKGFANYFLFWHDVIRAAKEELDLWIGAGRSSSCGSIVNYCLGITKIDPLKNDLLFNRFINPETILPDIDIDVEDGGQKKVFDYIRKKYGEEHCANIISYSKNKAGNIIDGKNVHVCGLVVSKNPTSDYVPMERISTNDDKELVFVSQYDGFYVEDMGVVKVDILDYDFLKKMRAVVMAVEETHNIHIDIDNIAFNDPDTLELFQSANTDNVLLLSSDGMQLLLKKMHPENFNDLVLLNTLYRPGLMDWIPEIIQRKNRKKAVGYEIPSMERILGESYGLIVYQEQVMQLSQMIAGFSDAEADCFRKDLGKKQRIKEWKERFIKGGLKNGHDKPILNKVWKKLCTIGLYVFNKSHIVAYTFMSYQMAYLKAHYPREFDSIMTAYKKY